MESRNYDKGPTSEDVTRLLDDADARIARLGHDRVAIAERRRALIEPAYRTVLANPSEIHHKIALGAVLVGLGLTASDADAVAGLLGSYADQVIADCETAVEPDPVATFGTALVRVIDRHERELTAGGLFESWARRLAAYQEDRAEWLARDVEFRLQGAWRAEAMTRGQRWLVRVTCRIRYLDLPGHLSRGDAADWLDAHGANVTYREFSA